MTWRTWRDATTDALYGPDGFYRRQGGPAAHFRTSVHVSPLFARALMRLAWNVFWRVDNYPDFAIVDVGAGRGELLRQLAELAPPRWRLIGVDVIERPDGLPERIEWRRGLRDLDPVPFGLLLANEWLDNIPVDVIEDGRLVEVEDDGLERPGERPSPRDLAWQRQWAAGAAWHDGWGEGRVEVGWPRDDAWVDALSRIGTGVAVAMDYGLDFDRSPHGTMTSYWNGKQFPALPNGLCDITSHVLLESCAEAAGGPYLLTDQRLALKALGLSAPPPPRELASSDPAAYLTALAAASKAAELLDPGGLGGFGWLVQPRGMDLPHVFGRPPTGGWPPGAGSA